MSARFSAESWQLPDQEGGWQTHELPIHDRALPWMDREWLLTNGTGAYAMGTIPGINTRRYHGLLIAATNPPVGRINALNQMYEQLLIGQTLGDARFHDQVDHSRKVELTTCHFRGDDGVEVFSPGGHAWLRHFDKGLTVRWGYAWNGIQIIRRLQLHEKEQAITLTYSVRGLEEKSLLRLGPMLTLRDFHAVMQPGRTEAFDCSTAADGGQLVVRRGGNALTLSCSGGRFQSDPMLWYGAHYAADAHRGQDAYEDYFVPGCFAVELIPDEAGLATVSITAALGESPVAPAAFPVKKAEFLEQVAEAIPTPQFTLGGGSGRPASASQQQRLRRCLAIAADDFIVERAFRGDRLSTILAGYPWFADWGRDTFISLPGLLLATGRHEEAGRTLKLYAQALKNGLVPNRFDDYDPDVAHYNTVDASLWFVHSLIRYHAITNDSRAWQQWILPAAMQVVEHYTQGTQDQIRVEEDGLVAAGSPSTQLTWMDAKCGGHIFTPRHGKAVEINALWYSNLSELADLIGPDNPQGPRCREAAEKCRAAFVEKFWNADIGYLNDHLWPNDQGDWQPDTTLRPNQILAVSLPRSPLDFDKQAAVVSTVRERLLTPFGLRTLSEDDPNYHPYYHGDQMQRDGAYHRGTIWPWLIGPYVEALLRTGNFSQASRVDAAAVISPLVSHMLGSGLGQLHEIHEAALPYRPEGCIAQAWSVAELLRVLTLIETGQAAS